MLALVANTDRRWHDYLRSIAIDGSLDEVNFWRPRSQSRVRTITPGSPFFLRLLSPINAVAGYGFFATWHLLPLREAWEVFGRKNGAPTFGRFLDQIASFRGPSAGAIGVDARPLGCIVLRDVHFLPERDWIPWGAPEGWSRNIVAGKTVDLDRPEARVLRALVHRGYDVAEEFADRFSLVHCDERRWRDTVDAVREGQGSFRLRLLDAYGERCAVSGERTVVGGLQKPRTFGPARDQGFRFARRVACVCSASRRRKLSPSMLMTSA